MDNRKNRRLTTEKHQKVFQNWLMQDYPGLFNDQFLPMAIGILDQLSQQLPAGISKTDLRTALGWYASRLKYLQNIVKFEHRCNLDGSLAGEISALEKSLASKKIKAIFRVKKATTAKSASEA